nr:MAG TPA: Protein of unknown function (DUF2591) [Caudoviricetes sp.]
MSTDYSKMSDFEIDKAVADALGIDYDIAIMLVNPVDKINGNHVEEYVRKKITSNEKHWKRFSPTRIPNDAWPVIDENNITIINDNSSLRFAVSEVVAYFNGSNNIWSAYENGLRAAMITFLKMQESKNAS